MKRGERGERRRGEKGARGEREKRDGGRIIRGKADTKSTDERQTR